MSWGQQHGSSESSALYVVFSSKVVALTTNLSLEATGKLVKLDELWQSSPIERDGMSKRDLDALGNLAIIVSFVQSFSASLKLPPASQSKRQLFIARAATQR